MLRPESLNPLNPLGDRSISIASLTLEDLGVVYITRILPSSDRCVEKGTRDTIDTAVQASPHADCGIIDPVEPSTASASWLMIGALSGEG